MDNPGEQQKIEILVTYKTDEQSAQKAQQSTKALGAASQKAGQAAADATKKFQQMREQAERLQMSSMVIGGLAAAILTPMTLAANKYVSAAGQAESASRAWVASTKSLEDSQTRIGRVVAEKTLPYLQQAAALAEKAAKFAEAHPESVDAALKLGGTLAAVASTGVIVSSMMKVAGSIIPILAKIAPYLGAVLMSPATLALAGISAGFKGADWLSETEWGKRAGVQSFAKTATVGAYGIGSLFGGEQGGLSAADFVATMFGLKSASGSNAPGGYNAAQQKSLADYQKNEQQAQKSHYDALARLQKDYTNQSEQAEMSYQRSRQQAIAAYDLERSRKIVDFSRSEARAEQDYYRQRQQAADRFGREMAQMERDHQKEMARLQEDHADRMTDLAEKRDAIGLLDEMKSYNRERSRAEQDYNDQVAQKNAAFAQELADNEAQFIREREQRAQDFAYQLALDAQNQALKLEQMDADYQYEAEQRAKQNEDKRKELEDAYQAERNLRRAEMNQSIRELADGLAMERQVKAEYTNAMAQDTLDTYVAYRSALDAASQANHSVAGARASGGYVNAGLYQMHDSEFVLNKQTTKALEAMSRSRLDQDIVLSLAAAGRSITYNDNRNYQGRLSPAQKMFDRQERDAIFSEVFG